MKTKERHREKAKRSREKKQTKNAGNMKFVSSIIGRISILLTTSLILTICLGVISYQKASDALSDSYIASTSSTIQAISNYFELGMSNIRTQAVQLYNDDLINQYHSDAYYNDVLAERNAILQVRSKYSNVTSVDEMCSNIYSISDKSRLVSANGQNQADNTYSQTKELFEQAGTSSGWFSTHPGIDAVEGTTSEEYAASYGMHLFTAEGYIMADLSADAVKQYINQYSIGNRGILSFVSDETKEFYAQTEDEQNEVIKDAVIGSGTIAGQEFYKEAMENAEESGFKYVTFNGEKYLFIYNKIADTKLAIVGLIPKSVVVNQASSIRLNTIIISAFIIVIMLVLGGLISYSMKKGIKQLNNNLDRLATGDFTVDFSMGNKDEFGVISHRVGETMGNLRGLIGNMKQMNDKVNESTMYVTGISNEFATSSEEISEALQEVANDVVSQANDADNCLNQMNQLSGEVQEVFEGTSKIGQISEETNKVVEESITIVDKLASNMKDSSDMTKVVIKNVENLSAQSKSIEKIVDVINEIAEETNLLSLNASIEAARAGEAGRGFVVVADQVRKLADQSVEQVVEIGKIVNNIQTKTNETVTVARQTEEYVTIQEKSLQQTVAMFDHIKNQFNVLVGELKNITDGVERIEKAKNETLTSVQNISSFTQETSAVTEEITATALNQLDNVGKLRKKIKTLEEEAEVLNEAISRFVVE